MHASGFWFDKKFEIRGMMQYVVS
uniref:Uncharacterized protein n=1 Tax=Arundo donax TaxID=35708 RepID=A0A0A8YUY8_ARUDO